jgi:hypothetical protein
MDLNQHGGASRCLLRLRENEGKPGISDRAFITAHLDRHPEWQQQPGAADAAMIFELAKELELADGMDVFRSYDRVLGEHRAARSVLVCTERRPQQTAVASGEQRYVTVLQAMDETSFTLWCPYPNGLEDVLADVPRRWWDEWLCLGLVLRHGATEARSGADVAALVSRGA